MTKHLFRESATALLVLACGLSMVFLLVSQRQKERLVGKIASLEKKVDNLSDVQVGDIVPSLNVVDLQEKATRLSFQEGQGKLLIVYSPECPACKLQSPEVLNQFASQINSKGYGVFGLSLGTKEETKVFTESRKLRFDSLIIADPKAFERAYRVRRVPQILLIKDSGTVEMVHHGTLDEDGLKDLLTQLDPTK